MMANVLLVEDYEKGGHPLGYVGGTDGEKVCRLLDNKPYL
jgi:hypothetical protein